MRDKIIKYVLILIFLLAAAAFVIKFSGPAHLKLYVKTGVGSCREIPVLCLRPDQEIINPQINKDYITELLPYRLAEIEVWLPEGFTVIKEKIKKVYYKKRKYLDKGSVAYLLYQKPDFFIKLFPEAKKQGINDDYVFLSRAMSAQPQDLKNLTDTFFVIMKSVLIPDLGRQDNVRMAKFKIADKAGFINYNLAKGENYFDCNIIQEQKGFFKIYIRDKSAKLSLDKVLAIISTVKKLE